MTLPDRDAARDWIGRTVVDRDGAEIGVCAALLADEATGLPEWMYADRDEVTVVVPLIDATGTGDRVQVTVTRADADGAPRFGPARELSQEQEAELYRHYGIEYSTSTSDSLLPAAEAEPTGAESTSTVSEPTAPEPTAPQPTAPEPTQTAPDEAAGQVVASGTAGRGRGVAAAVAALAALVAVVAAVRLRRGSILGSVRLFRRATPPPRSAAARALAGTVAARERAVQLAATAAPVVEASIRRAAVDAAQQGRAAAAVARTYTDETAARLTPLLATTGQAVWRAARAGTDSALKATDAATVAVGAALPRVAAGVGRAGRTGLHAVLTVGAAAEAVPEAIAETGERLEKGWRRVMGRLSLGLGFGVGYVLGARAGRGRYEQIRQAAAGFMERPEVQQAVEQVRAAAPAPLRSSIDKLSGGGAGRHSANAGGSTDTVDIDALVVDEVDVVVTPPPPVTGTGGPRGTDAPLADPLIPPAKSDDGPTGRP
ncbi:hypothetical protein [Geodermatophilus obscurus]|uniref:PRC-barrel domain-containing protein n=1 Tax=Geodermatophilus obscurus (strain ATCC 25078 / DSM 43160 / JCM 3152 / CCUG 61914 / KCC A-0152 / KCTC 9177 / NBRC 13315 / NRRL B-3577 / G-20) TaxID=526225 RepID=D2S9T8_GEOOG|nr:hypothetical protein [Geodermatophilus obscurus]ADB73801.1 hypothetical protein Gobs_1041 [Geodermatophilus obscurus DSM 43160]